MVLFYFEPRVVKNTRGVTRVSIVKRFQCVDWYFLYFISADEDVKESGN